MRALEFASPASTHGFQCQVGAVMAARIYDMLRYFTPNREKAIAEFNKFSYEDYKKQLTALIGSGAETMIRQEERIEHKYDRDKFIARLEKIIEKWDDILKIINEEIPTEKELISLLNGIGSPTNVSDLEIDSSNIGEIFEATRDIRDKYVLSRLIFDLGLTKEAKSLLKS